MRDGEDAQRVTRGAINQSKRKARDRKPTKPAIQRLADIRRVAEKVEQPTNFSKQLTT